MRRISICCGLLLASAVSAQQPCTVETIAGAFAGPPPGDGGPAVEAELVEPEDVREGPDGALYISDSRHRAIRRVDPDGTIATFAGTGERGFFGDGGPAALARLEAPGSMAFGPDGALYFKDRTRIRRIDTDGLISTVAGNGETNNPSIGKPALQTSVSSVSRIAVGPDGAVYALAPPLHQVFRIGSDGLLTLFAGVERVEYHGGGYGGDGGPANEAELASPEDLAVDSAGVVYILDRNNRRIRRVSLDGTIDTYAGIGPQGAAGPSPDGAPRDQIDLLQATELEIDGEDALYWKESLAIRRLPPGGVLETAAQFSERGTFYDLSAIRAQRVLMIRDRQVLQVFADGTTTVIAGSGMTAARGDGGPARQAPIGSIEGMASGSQGEVYFADGRFYRIRVIRPDGTIESVAGTGHFNGPSEEGLPALESAIQPNGMALDAQGRIVYSERRGRVMRLEEDGTLARIAGQGYYTTRCPNGICGDGGQALDATIPLPDGVAADSAGNIYVVQTNRSAPSRWFRRIRPDGVIETLEHPAEHLSPVSAFSIGPSDELIVGMRSTPQLWVFPPEGEPREVPGYRGFFRALRAVAAHPNGDIYLSDLAASLVMLDRDGRRRPIAGHHWRLGFEGGDGAVSDLRFGSISSLVMTSEGDLLVADGSNGRILRIYDIESCPSSVGPQISGVLHGASFGTGLAPGTVFSIFGLDVGPDDLAIAQPDGAGFPTEIAGTRVLFDGLPAPLIFAGKGQASGVIPWEANVFTPVDATYNTVRGQVVDVILERNGVRSEPRIALLGEARPAFFTLDSSGSGLAAALNQDGSVNGPLAPAPLGSVLVLFGSGFGPLERIPADGSLSGAPLSRLVHAPTILIDGVEAEVLYAGPAPGLVSGVVQVNARVPNNAVRRGAVSVEAVIENVRSPRNVQVVVGQ